MRWVRREVWMARLWWCEAAPAEPVGKILVVHGMNELSRGRQRRVAGQGTAKATPPGTTILFLEMKRIPKDVTCLW